MTLRFLYKIWSGYDGFTPKRLDERMTGDLLPLGWTQYLDDVSPGDEVWVYFHGTQAFTNGVHIKGKVSKVIRDEQRVAIRPIEFSSETPLTDNETSQLIGRLVARRGRQVFAMPLSLAKEAAGCNIDGDGSSCSRRKCEDCPVWSRYELIRAGDFKPPNRLERGGIQLVPAYWTVPRRSYLSSKVGKRVKELTAHFGTFKGGDETKAYPFALGMSRQLNRIGWNGSSAELVPIPLSPDKAKAGEVHRTKLLADQLGRLLGLPVVERVGLQAPISKRRSPWNVLSAGGYEHAYWELLTVKNTREPPERFIIVDDVCTRGSTIAAVARVLSSSFGESRFLATTAGLMVLKETVLVEDRVIA